MKDSFFIIAGLIILSDLEIFWDHQGAFAGPIHSETGDVKFVVTGESVVMSNYRRECLRIISNKWKRQPGDDKIIIVLGLRADGSLSRANMVEKSGDPELDALALNTVRNIKYPPFPSSYKRKGMGILVNFQECGVEALSPK